MYGIVNYLCLTDFVDQEMNDEIYSRVLISSLLDRNLFEWNNKIGIGLYGESIYLI